MSLHEMILDSAAKRAKIDRASIKESTLIDELQIDSLAFMDFIMQIEETECIVLNEDEIEEALLATKLGEIIQIVERAKANAVTGDPPSP